jgi:hypothetical protein
VTGTYTYASATGNIIISWITGNGTYTA